MTTSATTQMKNITLTPRTLDEAMRFAELLSQSSIVPKDYQGNPGNILVAVQWGMELGLQPLQAMQSIAVINGRPSIWGDAMLGIVRGSGLLEYIREDISDAGTTCTLKRRGDDEVSRTFTLDDAKRAGLLAKQGPWQNYPKRQMQMRARAFALRDVFPDVLRGIGIAEEVADIPTEPDMGGAYAAGAAVRGSRSESLRGRIAAKRAETTQVTPQAGDGGGLLDLANDVVDIPATEDACHVDDDAPLNAVLTAIKDAHDHDDMARAADRAAHLGSETAKDVARAAYTTKMNIMKKTRASRITHQQPDNTPADNGGM